MNEATKYCYFFFNCSYFPKFGVYEYFHSNKLMNSDGDSAEHAYFIDQNVQYYYQTTTGDGQMVMVGGQFKVIKMFCLN